MKQIEVTIMGQSYILGCPEGGERDLLAAVSAVDREMCGIRDAGKVKARERIAVLAALNLAFGLEQGPLAANSGPYEPPPKEGKDVDIDALVHRLDTALGDDGRLL